MVSRGQIWWVDLPEPTGSEPGFARPVLIIQADSFNHSRLQTVVVAALTTNLRLADAPGNVLLSTRQSGLAKNSVVNVSQLLILDKQFLREECGRLTPKIMQTIDSGIRLALDL